jgi:hypothetical protein
VLPLKASAPESIGTSDWAQTPVLIPSNAMSTPKALFILQPFSTVIKGDRTALNRDPSTQSTDGW